MRRNSLLMLVSVSVAFFGVIFYTYGATTISTNIETAGTLTVTGAAALNGGLTMDSTKFTVADGSGNTSIAGTLNVTGAVWATSTLQVTDSTTFYNTVTISGAKGLVLGQGGTPSGNTEGMIYYDSTNKVIKLNDGSSWYTVGTTTSGLTLLGSDIKLSDLATQYMTFGTTTQSGLSVLTLEATSTAAIPLTIRGYNAQTANLFQIHDVAGVKLFAIDASGNASTTMISASAGIWVAGAAALNGGLSMDSSAFTVADVSGNTAIGGTLTVTGKTTLGNASTTILSANFLEAGGTATTTITSGGFIGVATTSPSAEISASGAATTTLYMHSTARGGCIEMVAPNGTAYKMYISPTDTSLSTTTTSGRAGLVAIWELGVCK